MYSGTIRNVASLSRRKVSGKRKPVVLTFTSSAMWTVPAGVTKVDVFLVGGGGRGGAGGGDTQGSGGGGGGGGNVAGMNEVPVTPGALVSIVVGADNGASSFGSNSVKGGTQGGSAGYGGKGGNGNSGGGSAKSFTGVGGVGGNQGPGEAGYYSGGERLIAAVSGSIGLRDFNGVQYGNGGGSGGGGGKDVGDCTGGAAGGPGAGAGGTGSYVNLGGNGENGISNSGGGGGGGGGHYSGGGGGGSGGIGGSGVVQIRYWKE